MTLQSVTESGRSKASGNGLAWDRVVKVSCHNNCSYQRACILNAYVKDGVVVRIEQAANHPSQSDPDIPDWNPRGCQKGVVLPNRMYDPARIKHPLKRVGPRGSGRWQEVSWDQALTEIADTMLDVLTTDGPDTVFVFGGSAGSLVSDSMSFEGLMASLGVPASGVTGEIGDDHNGAAQVFGQPFFGSSADNVYFADIILIWGGNPSYTGITNYHFITEARYHGTKVITICPDYSPSALPADQWVGVNIGTDAALALSIAQVMIQEGLHKADFLREQTDMPLLVRTGTRRYLREKDLKRGGREDIFYFWDSKANNLAEAPRRGLALEGKVPALEGEFEVATLEGRVKVRPVFEVLKEKLNKEYTPERASKVTGVSPNTIRQLARDFGKARGMCNISTFNWGKFYHGDLIERSIILDFVLAGHIGRKGATYNAFTQLSNDATIGGVSVRTNIMLGAAAASDPRYAQWMEDGWTPEMIIMQYAREAYQNGHVFGTSFFHYVHSGLLDISQKHNSWDKTLKRPVAEYVKEAFDRGWQLAVPRRGKDPRIIFNMGGGALRRPRASNVIIENLLPKLKLMVALDWRMASTNLYSDYVLPCAGWFEKWNYVGCAKIELPYGWIIQKAVEPLGESKSEWELGLMLAKKLQDRALARGITSYADKDGAVHRLDTLYNKVTIDGMYLEEDDEAVARDFYFNTANVEHIDWEEFKERGYVAATGTGQTSRSIGNACDIVPGETVVPLTYHTEKKQPYPTLTRRIQFYVDHDWYLELGQELPAQLEDPKAGGDYPIRVTGGHARWSIHSIQADEAIMLRLQRGEPAMFMSAQDARARGIQDGDWVEARNDMASTRIIAAVSPAVRPGQAMIYHSWENFQFLGKRHFKNIMPSPLNPIELVGGYFHISPWPVCFYPGFSDRETRIEVRKA
ncbi:MAG: molybdopterin-dependent oxidoreductase [Chloroflexi bacterium]|nr:molybdopterin-dependent oxidoreductase [Chloroflexota bacterium]